MSCNSPNDQNCGYPYNQSVDTIKPNPGVFGPLELNQECQPKDCDQQPSRIWNEISYENACPAGYTIDPDVKKNPCAYAQNTYSIGPLGCGSVSFYQLVNACIPETPNIEFGDKVLCCSTGLDCPNKSKGLPCCPANLCPRTDECGPIMNQYCLENGYTNFCQFYLNNSPNERTKQIITQNLINNELKKNPNLPLDKQPALDSIIEMCKIAPPGTCDEILKNECKNYSRENLQTNRNIQTLCGCFMNLQNYLKYKSIIGEKDGKLLTQCDPACMNAFSIQPGSNCQFDRCNSPICIINFDNKNVQQEWISGVDLSQNCVAVGTDPSKCFIGMSKADAEKYLSREITVNEKCNSCFLWDPTNPTKDPIQLNCNDVVGSIAKAYGIPVPSNNNYIIYLIIGIIIIFLIIVLIFEIKY